MTSRVFFSVTFHYLYKLERNQLFQRCLKEERRFAGTGPGEGSGICYVRTTLQVSWKPRQDSGVKIVLVTCINFPRDIREETQVVVTWGRARQEDTGQTWGAEQRLGPETGEAVRDVG